MQGRMDTNQKLINHLVENDRLETPEIIDAFTQVDRAQFIFSHEEDHAYIDAPLSIGFGQTISQPSTVAIMFELLGPEKGDRILDVGSGSGWTTALLAQIVGKEGKVTGMELVPELVEFGKENLEKYDFSWAEIKQAKEGILGIPGQEYDKILVSASADTLPENLLDQLKPGGTMVIPVRNTILRITKDERGEIEEEEYPGFVFVPLIR